MNMQRTLTLALALTVAGMANAQKMKVVQGSFDALKGQKKVDLAFTYDNMKVGKYDEPEYISKKTEEYNEKEPGKGDTWAKSWVSDRESRFEPKFEVLFNDGGKIQGARGNDDAQYQLKVHTTFTEPGFNVGVMRRDASINADVYLVEKSSGKELGKMTVVGVPGGQFGGYDFDSGSRLTESYAKLGKELRKWLDKKLK
ncbi:MAG: hypothetical protein H6597_06515 [Flavobacteriales bacterium]|nr:hypothetical protein [Flavobacteriales bacterium]MCB9194169.1 hypothetical protein [Flavobacteriales bacterium]